MGDPNSQVPSRKPGQGHLIPSLRGAFSAVDMGKNLLLVLKQGTGPGTFPKFLLVLIPILIESTDGNDIFYPVPKCTSSSPINSKSWVVVVSPPGLGYSSQPVLRDSPSNQIPSCHRCYRCVAGGGGPPREGHSALEPAGAARTASRAPPWPAALPR